MKKEIESLIQSAIQTLQDQAEIPKDLTAMISIERTQDKLSGDYTTNAAMMLAKTTELRPRELAEKIVSCLPQSKLIQRVTIGGPGYINFFLSPNAFLGILPEILNLKKRFGLSTPAEKEKIHVELLSANPTGPLQINQGRVVAYGQIIADLLESMGHEVTREYYVNDASRQIDILTVSIWLRYLELYDENIYFPTEGFHGDYVVQIAKSLKEDYKSLFQCDAQQLSYQNTLTNPQDENFSETEIKHLISEAKILLGAKNYRILYQSALHAMYQFIEADLKKFDIQFSTKLTARELKLSKTIEQAIQILNKGNYTYEKDGALWFKTSSYGDDRDHQLIRTPHQYTYFASDIAYLKNKIDRGFKQFIYVYDANHASYVPRLQAAAHALSLPTEAVKIIIIAPVSLYKDGKKISLGALSQRSLGLSQILDELGKDKVRYSFMRSNADEPCEIILDSAKNTNAGFDLIKNVYDKLKELVGKIEQKKLKWDKNQSLASLHYLAQEEERTLLADIDRYKEQLSRAQQDFAPSFLIEYLLELAEDVDFYFRPELLESIDEKLLQARITLLVCVKQIMENVFEILSMKFT